MKSILNKSEDPYLGLLACHTQWVQPVTTPNRTDTEINYQTHFAPYLPNQTQVTQLREEQKAKHQKKNFDCRHKSRNLKPFKKGETVWMSDRKESETVMSKVAPRSYLVKTTGGEYQRNRKSLIPLSVTAHTLNNGLPDVQPNTVLDN